MATKKGASKPAKKTPPKRTMADKASEMAREGFTIRSASGRVKFRSEDR